jgi:hypothetical protein
MKKTPPTVHSQNLVHPLSAPPAAQHQPAPRDPGTPPKTVLGEAATLQRLIEENPDGVLLVDRDDVVRFVNPAAEQMLGRSAAELIGSTFGVPLVHDNVFELNLVRPTGEECIAEMRVVETTWQAQPAFIVTLRDVTSRDMLERQLRQAQKMEALGRLAGGISHDFNNMLTSIICEASVLAEQLDLSDPRRRSAEQICRIASRAADLTGQLLTFSRKRVLKTELIDVAAATQDLEKMVRRIIGDDIKLTVRLPEEPLHVELGRGVIEQILLNLVVNARDAMPRGGDLTIDVAGVRVQTDEQALPAGLECVSIVVSDNGCGMDSGVQARLFEPFFTTKPDGQGTGLGLAVVYGFVKQAGGRISVLSEPEAGSSFHVLLPRAAAPQATAEVAKEDVDLSASAPRIEQQVLLVEDEDAVREVLQEILVRAGYEVIAAENGAEALEIFARVGTAVDLLVTDVAMPRMDGAELVRQLRPQAPDLPVLFLSGYPATEDFWQSLQGAAVAFLAKPFLPAELLREVRNCLSGRASKSLRI